MSKEKEKKSQGPAVRLSKDTHDYLKVIAKKNRRKLTDQLELIIEVWKDDHPADAIV